MLIDIHGHYSRKAAGGIPPARVTTYAGVCKVDLVLVSNFDAAAETDDSPDLDETEANQGCLEVAAEHDRLVPVYWARVGQVDSNVNAFFGALATEAFVGAMFHPAAMGLSMGDEAFRPYLGALTNAGKPALIALTDDDACAPDLVYDQARQFPRLPVVLCPARAGAPRRNAALEVVRQASERKDANLFLATSHAAPKEVVAMVQTVGAERLLYGSNAISGESHVPRQIAFLEETHRLLDKQAYAQLTAANALRLFRLQDQVRD